MKVVFFPPRLLINGTTYHMVHGEILNAHLFMEKSRTLAWTIDIKTHNEIISTGVRYFTDHGHPERLITKLFNVAECRSWNTLTGANVFVLREPASDMSIDGFASWNLPTKHLIIFNKKETWIEDS